MKRQIAIFGFMIIANVVIAQDVVKYNVIYTFKYVRDLENKDVPYSSTMVLSLGKSSSRYCTEKLFKRNDKKTLEARKKQQENLQALPSASMITVAGGPMLTVGKSGAIIDEEILKNLSDKKHNWKQITLSNPNGYKSSVEFIDNNRLITCGTSGVDLSKDKGVSWEKMSDAPFHIVKKHPTKSGAYLAGAGGRISFVEL